MTTLSDRAGAPCAELHGFNLDGLHYGLSVRWLPGATHDLDLAAALEGARAELEVLRAGGARSFESRIVREDAGADPELLAKRAAALESLLRALGFTPQGGRVEVRVSVEQAIAHLTPRAAAQRLVWIEVPTEEGALLDRAAALLKRASEGDPSSDPDDDARGFLLARLDDDGSLHTPETLQIGTMNGEDAAIVVLSINPDTGWCSHHYLAVSPRHRGLGLSREAILHGLHTLHTLGGREYHDGTSAGNRGALALLESLGPGRRSVLEQWQLREGR